MRRLFAGGWIVTCDDAGTEHPDGLGARRGRIHLAVGRGRGAGSGRARRPRRRGRHARARQHAPPPVPDPHPRAGPAGRSLQLAPRALPAMGGDRRRVRARRGAHRARRARALGMHDRLRPPLRLPARAHGARRGRGRRPRASSASASSRRAARWTSGSPTAGSRPTSSSRSSTPCSPRPSASSRALHEPGPGARVQIAVAPCSPFSVTRRLMKESAAARPPSRPRPAHAPSRDRGGERVLPRAVRLHPGRVPHRPRLARRRRVVRALRPPLPGRHPGLRRDRNRCRALPHFESPTGRWCRTRTRARRRGRPRRARRRRLGVERAERPAVRGEAGAARRARAWRAGGDDRPRGAPARDAGRRVRARPRRPRLARAGPAAPTLAIWRTDVLELGGAEDPVAGLVLSAPHRVDRLVVGGEDVVRGGALVRADEDEIARVHRAQARRFAA